MIGFATLDDMQRVVDAVHTIEGNRPSTRRLTRRQPVFSSLPIALGKTDAALNKGTFASPTSGTISVWSGNVNFASMADSTTDITAYNFFGNIGSGKQVICIGHDLGWLVLAAEC